MPARGHSAKNFFLKKIKLYRAPARGHSAKNFFLKKIKNLCRVPAGLALSKETVNGAGAVTVAFLWALGKAFAECPIKDTRQRGLCRSIFCHVFFAECLKHSAKNLNPIVISAVGNAEPICRNDRSYVLAQSTHEAHVGPHPEAHPTQ